MTLIPTRLKITAGAALARLTADPALREMVTGSSFVLKIQLLGTGASYLFFLFVSRRYGPEAVGLFNIAYTVLFMLALLARLGLDNALVVFITSALNAGQPAKGTFVYHKCLRLVMGIGIVLAAACYATATPMAAFFGNDQLRVPLRIMACLLPPFLFASLTAHALRGFGHIRDFALLQSTNFFVIAILLLGIGLSCCETIYLPEYAWAGAVCGGAALSALLLARRTQGHRGPEDSHVSYRSMLAVSMPMLLSGIMFALHSWTDALFLGYFRPETDVGTYHVAKKISLLITLALFAVNAMAEKQFARFHVQGDVAALKRLGLHVAWINTLLAAPVFLVIACFPDWFITLFGPGLLGGRSSLVILCVTQLISAFCGSVLNLLNMTGHERLVSRIVTAATVVNLCLSLWLIPLLGMRGAAIAALVSTSVWGLSGVWFVHRHFHFWMLPGGRWGRDKGPLNPELPTSTCGAAPP